MLCLTCISNYLATSYSSFNVKRSWRNRHTRMFIFIIKQLCSEIWDKVIREDIGANSNSFNMWFYVHLSFWASSRKFKFVFYSVIILFSQANELGLSLKNPVVTTAYVSPTFTFITLHFPHRLYLWISYNFQNEQLLFP